ncbi:hypothetical protein BWQ96_05582 [Gracilariopsis chorda]|uniref:Carbohydrate kinase PfkB domain-containing protein n=1 Tax=Gracilariopsis chorda TaxID=448386 RepID=A0A2V3IU45_9FLOR|nr:hypothetical protein BWQ96_05582 [Gracilariopsis chorda]|eukprot:PXF44640.1 hypothetical protein BWQ96_05582 [Gracilariopsis chorda]
MPTLVANFLAFVNTHALGSPVMRRSHPINEHQCGAWMWGNKKPGVRDITTGKSSKGSRIFGTRILISIIQDSAADRPRHSTERRSNDARMALQHDSPKPKRFDIVSAGNMCIDILLPIDHYPVSRGEHQRLRKNAFLEIGGSLNALLSATRLEAKTAALAYVRGDTEGTHPSDLLLTKYLKEIAEREGIETSGFLPHSRGTITTCAALLDSDGTHTFLASNEEVQEHLTFNETLPRVMRDLVHQSKALIIDGYALHSDRELVEQCLDSAIESDCEVWVDPQAATASLLQNRDDLFLRILRSAHGISLNMEEARMMTAETEPERVLRALPSFLSADTVLLKDGPYGCHALVKGELGEEFCSIPGFDLSEAYKDSVGAGDAFLGAFLAGRLVHSLELRACCILANTMAAGTCMQHGAGASGISSISQAKQLLEANSLKNDLILQVLSPDRQTSG